MILFFIFWFASLLCPLELFGKVGSLLLHRMVSSSKVTLMLYGSLRNCGLWFFTCMLKNRKIHHTSLLIKLFLFLMLDVIAYLVFDYREIINKVVKRLHLRLNCILWVFWRNESGPNSKGVVVDKRIVMILTLLLKTEFILFMCIWIFVTF